MKALVVGAALVCVVSLAGCASAPQPDVGGGLEPGTCRDARFKGRYEPGANRGVRRFSLFARVCGGGQVLFEVKGPVGGAALIAELSIGQDAHLMFPGKRLVVHGPDREDFWRRWTDVPLSGAVIAGLTGSPPGGGRSAHGSWTIEVDPPRAGRRLPSRVSAESAAGDRLVLRLTDEGPARGAARLPAPPRPEDWTVRDERGAPAGGDGDE